MAQWSRQYSGNTHGTRVQDLEQQLQHAIDVFRSRRTSQDAAQSRETVLRMADKLLAARIRKRKVNAPQTPDGTDSTLQRLARGGVEAILREYNVFEEVHPDDTLIDE